MTFVWVLLGMVVAIAGTLALTSVLSRSRTGKAETQSQRILLEAQAKEKEILLEAKDEALRLRASAEAENKERRSELQRQERRIGQKEETLDRKMEGLERKERGIANREKEIETLHSTAEELRQRQQTALEEIARMTTDEARHHLLDMVEREMKMDIDRRIRILEQEARDESERRAQKIIGLAIQRCAAETVVETTVSVVTLPNDEMKGRIIGKEGRNIRALEAATGVDLIIDDTPEAVILSAFDPVRREVARVALTKLMTDGRIHPGRIEEIVAKARQEVDTTIREAGEHAAFDAGVHGLHPDLVKLLGRLKFRTSYGQNVLNHSIEVAHLCATMAAEIGADVNVVRRGGLLHDIGKAVDHEVEGPHALIGADIVKRLGMSPKVVHTVAAHHHDEEPSTIEAFIVAAGDAISAARPGARRETVSTYIKRLESLEEIANAFPGVDRSFAVQAGRELRIAVRPEEIDDLASIRMARDVAKQIEESLEYPGQIKVTVIREKRAVDYAR